MTAMIKCHFCEGPVKAERITHFHRWADQVVILEDVPAEVCQQCGEVYFGPDVLRAMDRVMENNHDKVPTRELRVPVYSFSRD